jgi:hypothetical protein
MRKNQVDKANNLGNKTGKLVYEHRCSILTQVDSRSSKELWAVVMPTLKAGSCNRPRCARFGDKFADPDAVSEYFANIATDTHYDSGVIEKLIDSTTNYLFVS